MPAQPIAIDDLLAYLLAALDAAADREPRSSRSAGADRVSYGDLMREYARQRGLRRLMIPVPVLTPRLSSLWLGLVTPLYARVGRKLIDSIRHPTVVRDDRARGASSRSRRCGIRDAIARALATRTASSPRRAGRTRSPSSGAAPTWFGGVRFGSRLVDSRALRVAVAAARGLRADPAHRRRDRLVRRRLAVAAARLPRSAGRRRRACAAAGAHPRACASATRSTAGASRPSSRIACCASRAEMKLPGRAWLEFEVDTRRRRRPRIRQTAIFDPVGSRRARSTGTASTRSTRSSSAACFAGSRARPSPAWR